jgi:hypothetical protein
MLRWKCELRISANRLQSILEASENYATYALR